MNTLGLHRIEMEVEATSTAALASSDLSLRATELGKRKEKQRTSQHGSAEVPSAMSQRAGSSAPGTIAVSISSPWLVTCLKGTDFSSCQLLNLCLPSSSPRLAKHQPPPPHPRAEIGTARGYLHPAVTNTDALNFNSAHDCLLTWCH